MVTVFVNGVAYVMNDIARNAEARISRKVEIMKAIAEDVQPLN